MLISIVVAMLVIGVSVGLFSNGSCKSVAVFSNTKNPEEMSSKSGTSNIGLLAPNLKLSGLASTL